jgi:hypothetical protein
MPTFQDVVDALESKRDSDYANGRRQGLLEAARLARERDHSGYDANDCRDNLNTLAKDLERLAGEEG